MTELIQLIAPQDKLKPLLFLSLCSIIELYDYLLYPLMIFLLAQQYFSFAGDDALNWAYLSFALSLVAMPISTVMWCMYYEKYGKTRLVDCTIRLIGLPSFLIALWPSYNDVGLIAPIGLFVFRIIQCVSASGEVKSAKILAITELGPSYIARASGFISASSIVGSMLAFIVGSYCIKLGGEHSWRLAFLSGAIMVQTLIYLRKKFSMFGSEISNENNKISISELFDSLKNHPLASFKIFLSGGMLGMFNYFVMSSMSFFIKSNGGSEYLPLIVAFVVMTIAALAIGFYLDLIKKKFNPETNMIKALVFIIFCSFAGFSLVHYGNQLQVIFGMVILGVALGFLGPAETIMTFLIAPKNQKFSNIMIPYNLGVAIFGGFSPIVMKLLYQQQVFYPSLFISGFALVIIAVLSTQRTARHPSQF